MKIGIVACVLLSLTARRSLLAQTVINFEDLSVGTTVTTQYAAKGVVFSVGGMFGAYLFEDTHAHSGTHVLRLASPATEFPPGTLMMQFTAGQRSVKFFASLPGANAASQGTAQAFDAAGNVIATDGPKAVQPNNYSTSFLLASSHATIVKVEIQMADMVFEAIDDLTFVGGNGTLPHQPPVVKITSPSNGAELSSQNVLLTGTVSGRSLFGQPSATINIPQPPGTTAPPFTFFVPLSGTGNTRRFSWSGGVGLGPQTVTVTATNIAGLTGTASATFDYLPAAIKNRYQQEGGSVRLGAFSFGIGGGLGCTIAVYQQGAIFYLPDKAKTFLAVGSMFAKWLQTQGQFRRDLSCATSEETPVNGFTGTTRQDFQQGRLYASGGSAFYVPPVFADAIDKLGGEVAVGVPVSDPPLLPPVPVWNFQRFQMADNVSLPSTLEISGSPPVLLVQRQGGDPADLQNAGLTLTQSTPTLEWQFSCSRPDGPCNVAPPISPPISLDALAVCAGPNVVVGCGPPLWTGTYPGDSREWVAVTDDQAETFVSGYVQESHPTDIDNPLSHEHVGPPVTFVSDWEIHLWPLGPFRSLMSSGKPYLKIEYEEYYAHALEAGWGWPLPGDLLFAAGRWIVDCGHCDFHAEIHPPAVMVFSRTIQHLGRPATDAVIWVNGFYTGAEVNIAVEAPPRPAPNANLVLEKPTDATAALGLNLQLSWDAHAVRGRFSAPLRQMSIDSNTGEMFWQDLRGYQGEWILYWDQ